MKLQEPLLVSIQQHSQDLAALECDGFSQVASYLLAQAGISHDLVSGKLKVPDQLFFPPVHHWVELGGGWVLDYRVRCWLPLEEQVAAPHGLFRAADLEPEYQYQKQLSLGSVNSNLYQILCVAGKPF